MNNFFKCIKKAILANNPQDKSKYILQIQQDLKNNIFSFEPTNDILVFREPSFSPFCTIVPAHKVPQRKDLNSDEGKIALIHAIAHIEYSAIDLALDACYRFQDMPKQYYIDWFDVALDELRHFNMLTDLLKTYNKSYGDLYVHQGLFDASMRTLTIIPRMALIPRYMEANGLDASLMIINKLKKLKNTQNIINVLEIILEEEVDHVKKGDIWYKYACNLEDNFSCNYFDIVNKVYPNSFKKNKHLNIEARKKAGFSQSEIHYLSNL